jgi:hypothetical protein
VSGRKAGDLAWIGVHKSASKYTSIEMLKCILLKLNWGDKVKICLGETGCESIGFVTKLINLMVALKQGKLFKKLTHFWRILSK